VSGLVVFVVAVPVVLLGAEAFVALWRRAARKERAA
jgi:hypothetical protein